MTVTLKDVWIPPQLSRSAEERTFRMRLQSTRLSVAGHRFIETFTPGEAFIAAKPLGAGAPALQTMPLRISAAGWVLASPLRLSPHEQVSFLWWTYLAALAVHAVRLDLPRTAARWVADELDRDGVTRWRDAPEEQLSPLVRVASAALVIVADGELHARGDAPGTSDPSAAEEWAKQGRVNFGRLGWRDALTRVRDASFPPALVEPWGPMLDVSGVLPQGALEIRGPVAEQLKRLARSVQGHARDKGTPAEHNVNWIHEHPEVDAAWACLQERERSGSVSRLAYQFGQRARDAAMQAAQERLSREDHDDHDAPSSGLVKAMQELSTALKPVLAGHRGDHDNTHNEQRVDRVLLAWSDVGQDIPHLRPALSELQLELDPVRCLRLRVSGVALDPQSKTVFVNLGAGLGQDELKYAFAELALHLVLGHPARGADKDADTWNYACDLLLAGWLEDMGYGARPDFAPYDPVLSKLPSAEAIYLRLLDDPTKLRRRASLRGQGLSDLLGAGEAAARALTDEEDRLWREAAARGMEEADALRWAGTLPAGLDRELRERAAEPIPWRPALQAYLGSIVPRRVRRRTYARPSRRSSLDPHEPRAGRGRDEPGPRHSLVLVVDTSGSMSDRDLAEALGGVRTTCQVLGIERVRVLACDAGVTDHGWQVPWRAGDRLILKGGGGTSLIPALALADQLALESDGVHPDTPMLIVTDGLFDDRVSPAREHAFLMPPGTRLLFPTRAPVFTVRTT
ncbi:vWA domain-containing protein [Deinococcus peraridilitoris]|uniref:Uncharacterized protein n=1 Tax=Deinococcus peraridilitoris (strain DSM 19664 / LMG 22246 / CIP 109416 / KR-200) TaxID=937777 RepID=L0A043_DEIPD|nr:VWA-like domain-containing protein [Deinococcus peraridilitoris]AFZ67201.1 hypothetical protein Deipe_1669 [Deinococcus peraridilitoris DSM 19664]